MSAETAPLKSPAARDGETHREKQRFVKWNTRYKGNRQTYQLTDPWIYQWLDSANSEGKKGRKKKEREGNKKAFLRLVRSERERERERER